MVSNYFLGAFNIFYDADRALRNDRQFSGWLIASGTTMLNFIS
ncbi:hypothetical protein QUB37_05250 [Microcoleus sp. AT3-A2]